MSLAVRTALPCSVLFIAGLFISAAWCRAQDGPLPASEAAQHMTVPEGFQVTLFAGEPDIVQPIAFTFDDRGRLWVVECTSYPNWAAAGHDRILIFEDRDGDGHFDTCKVFWDKGANVTGIALGFGGVWLTAIPNLLFIPDKDGDDVPDGPPEVLLDGWDMTAKHNIFNGLNWGPDGWLYGLNGILSNSAVGKPGTPAAERTKLNCGVWRFHPLSREFEVVASGTTNPWGIDWDEYGQTFITNCVISHLWHVIPGAHYQRMFGQDLNPNVYGLMPGCADHIHWAGGPWEGSRGGGKHAEAGGGHAHVGAMVYLGDNWPNRYRNSLFTCNLHGNRVNNDTLEPAGSGYVAHHSPDFLLANDSWFRGLAIQYGPDGGVYLSDWTDTGECHNHQVVDRTNGRIYKITHGKPKVVSPDLAKLSDVELVSLQLHRNDWFVRHARRILQERAAAGTLDAGTNEALLSIVRKCPAVTRQLRALWALHATGGLNESVALELLASKEPYMRGWAMRLALDDRPASPAMLEKLAGLAKADRSPVVRLHLASALQRLPLDQRWPIAAALAAHAEDTADPSLPLMIWYGSEPLVEADPPRALELLAGCRIPLVRRYLAQRSVASNLAGLVRFAEQSADADVQADVLAGIQEAFQGRREVPMPDGWQAAYEKLSGSAAVEVRDKVMMLALQFGDPRAVAALHRTVSDTQAEPVEREKALGALVQHKDAALLPLLQSFVKQGALRGAALRGLAVYGDEATPALVIENYANFSEAEKRDAVNTLSSRPSYALALLAAVEQGQIPKGDLSAFTIRQLAGLNHSEVTARVAKVWGAARPTAADKAALIAQYKSQLAADVLAKADLGNGRLLFSRTCAACHRLFDDGGKVGPDLTGSQRANLDYILENMVDPNAVVGRDFQMTIVETKDGRVINGIVSQENDNVVTLQTPEGSVILPKDEIETRRQTPQSLMPEELLAKLTPDEVRDLVAYLASPTQVPIKK